MLSTILKQCGTRRQTVRYCCRARALCTAGVRRAYGGIYYALVCGSAAKLQSKVKNEIQKNNTTNVVLCSTNDDLSPAAVQLH